MHLNCARKQTIVISDDTDLLVLMIYHFRDDMNVLYLSSETSARSKKAVQYTNISTLTKKLSPRITKHLLFAHAWSECDTTSAIFGHGKGEILKHLQQSKAVRNSKRI